MNLILFLISLGLTVVDTNAQDCSASEFVFDRPDLVATTLTSTGDESQLEAFGSRQNAAILNCGGTCGNTTCREIQKLSLYWVSIGQPEIVAKSELNEIARVFHFQPEGFHFYIQMLTEPHRQLLAETASSKYSLSILPNQIARLVLDRFNCKLSLRHSGKSIVIHGQVHNFDVYPLRMDFNAPEESQERNILQSQLNGSEKAVHLKFLCELASVGKVVKTNKLSISSEDLQSLHLQEQLLGQANNAYVTRNQLNTLASRIYSSLNIVEEYEVPEDQFQSIFVNDLIGQAVAQEFTHVPVLEALRSLSSFGINTDHDLIPDEILRDMSSVLEVNNESSWSHVIVNQDKFNAMRDKSRIEVNAKVCYSLVEVSANAAHEKELEWQSSTKSLDDQLEELNEATSEDMTWDIQGLKVIPKTLNVAKLTKSSLERTWNFNRIKKSLVETTFKRTTTLYVDKVQMIEDTNAAQNNHLIGELQCFIKKDCLGENNFLQQFSTLSRVDCLRFCQGLAECAWFTFHPNENWCKAYKDCSAKGTQSNCSNCISGQRTCDVKCSVVGNCRGNMISMVTSKTNLECLVKCQQTTGCQWHSYNMVYSTCLLFKNCPHLELGCKTCRTSSIHCAEDEDQCFIKKDCLGENNFLQQFSAMTKVECLRLCQSLDECAWFTFHSNENWCIAHRHCLSKGTQNNCTNCISGQRTCDVKCSVIGNCIGHMISNVTSRTDLECLGKCKGTEGCQWHSYDLRFLTCQLFKSCKKLDIGYGTCRTSSIHCAQDYSKVLVALGNSDDVEVVDLLSPESTCHKPDKFPFPSNDASGGLGFQNKPLICRGFNILEEACHVYEGGAWRKSDYLKQRRALFAITKSPFQDGSSKLFLTGGFGDSGYSSEVLTENGWQVSVPLPFKISYHCMVTVNSTSVMVIGGEKNDQTSGRSFLFNSETNIWNEGPTLNKARRYHSCGSIRKNSQTEDKSVIAVGGFFGISVLRSVEVLDLDSNAWRSGPDLSIGIYHAAMVEDPSGGVILIGGHGDGIGALDTLYRLTDARSDSRWQLMTQKLKSKRNHHTAFLIPDEIAACN